MKVWHTKFKKEIDAPDNLLKFYDEIINVCKKYNLSISCEDSHAGFIIENYDDYNIEWLLHSTISFDGKGGKNNE